MILSSPIIDFAKGKEIIEKNREFMSTFRKSEEVLSVETPEEYSKKTKTRKRNVYPIGAVKLNLPFFSGTDRLTDGSNYDGIMDSFANKAYGDLSTVHTVGFTMTSGCAADEVADLIDGTATTIGETENGWFKYLENLTVD
jgi:hypothetical protein